VDGRLLVSHPFNRVVIYVADLISNQKLLCVYDSFKARRWSMRRDWLESNAAYRTWLLDLKLDALIM
jgi:hypothetical protein